MFKPIRPETLMQWAEKKLGPSKCKRIMYINRKKVDWLGEWDWEGLITINLHRVKSYSTLYRTVAMSGHTLNKSIGIISTGTEEGIIKGIH